MNILANCEHVNISIRLNMNRGHEQTAIGMSVQSVRPVLPTISTTKEINGQINLQTELSLGSGAYLGSISMVSFLNAYQHI